MENDFENKSYGTRKRSTPLKFKLSDSTANSISIRKSDLQSSKGRPRGRPPLVSKKGTKAKQPQIKVEPVHHLTSQDDSVFEPFKQKLPPSQISQMIMSRLMIEEPLSLTQLQNYVPEASKEIIQTILDVFHVMDIVIPMKSKAGNHPPNTIFYSLNGFAKGSEACDFQKIEEVTMMKHSRASEIRRRSQLLQELSDLDIPIEEKKSRLRNLLVSFVDQRDSSTAQSDMDENDSLNPFETPTPAPSSTIKKALEEETCSPPVDQSPSIPSHWFSSLDRSDPLYRHILSSLPLPSQHQSTIPSK